MFKTYPYPKTDEEAIAQVGKVFTAAAKMEMPLEVEGAMSAWAAGTKLLVEEDDAGGIVGLCFMASGPRWNDSRNASTIIAIGGKNREGMLEYARSIASILDSEALIYEQDSTTTEKGRVYTVLEEAI